MMTLSVEERRQHMVFILERMSVEVGDHPVFACVFTRKEHAWLDEVPRTTFDELEQGGYIQVEEFFGGNRHYQLTPAGWLKAFVVTDRLDTEQEQERREVLLRVLKSKVAARSGIEVVDGREVAQETGLPSGWVCNAVESQLLDHCYPNRHFRLETNGAYDIVIPPTFGLEPVDL